MLACIFPEKYLQSQKTNVSVHQHQNNQSFRKLFTRSLS